MKGTIEAERLRRQGVDVVDLGRGRAGLSDAGARRRRPRTRRIDAQLHEVHGQHGHRWSCARPWPRGTAQDYGVDYRPDEVIITAGGKQALLHAAFALFGPGDEVITHAPGWPTIVEQIKLAGATPVIVRTRAEDGFALDGRRVAGRRDAAHARHRHQLAGQSDRRAAVGGRSARARRRGGAGATSGS